MIYIVMHKAGKLPNLKNGYRTIQAGAQNHPDCGADVQDNGGGNISEKNGCYCELTALYWMWKNCKEDIVGLCHYRRFFAHGLINSLRKKPMEYQELEKMLVDAKVDFIVRKKLYLQHTRGEAIDGNEKSHSKALEQCFQLYFPEYMSAYIAYRSQHGMHQNNMFISSRSEMTAYCAWLFDFLKHMEDLPDGINPFDTSRDAGYISEHLLNIYLLHNQKKILELDVTNLATSFIQKIGARGRDMIYKKLYQ